MNATQALAKARKALGSKAFVRNDPCALVGEEREAARAALVKARAEAKAAEEARDARRAEVLKADAEYQRLKKAAAEAQAAVDRLPRPWHRRVTIGTDGGFFFSVKAEGDTYAEAIAALTAAKAKA